MKRLFSIIILVCSLIVLLFFNNKQRRSIADLKSQTQGLRNVLVERNFVEHKLWSNNQHTKSVFKQTEGTMGSLVYTELGNARPLNQIHPGTKKVFFRYFELGCNTCTEEVITKINA